jgi:hypothetical protein
MKTDHEAPSSRFKIVLALIVLGVVVAVWLSTPYIVAWLVELKTPGSNVGTFGDQFGATNALFSGIAMFAMVLSLYWQRKELRLVTLEIEETREAIKNQNEQVKMQIEEMKHDYHANRMAEAIAGLPIFSAQLSKVIYEEDGWTFILQIINSGSLICDLELHSVICDGTELAVVTRKAPALAKDGNKLLCFRSPEKDFDLITFELGFTTIQGHKLDYRMRIRNDQYDDEIVEAQTTFSEFLEAQVRPLVELTDATSRYVKTPTP